MNDKIKIIFKEEKENVKQDEVLRFNTGGVELKLIKETGILQLLSKNGNVLSEVDFPTEKIITSAYYDEQTKELVIEFENANAVRIPITTNLENLDEIVIQIIEENSEEVDSFGIGTSENYNIESDEQVPTTKSVKTIVDNEISIAIENAITKVLNEEV